LHKIVEIKKADPSQMDWFYILTTELKGSAKLILTGSPL